MFCFVSFWFPISGHWVLIEIASTEAPSVFIKDLWLDAEQQKQLVKGHASGKEHIQGLLDGVSFKGWWRVKEGSGRGQVYG